MGSKATSALPWSWLSCGWLVLIKQPIYSLKVPTGQTVRTHTQLPSNLLTRINCYKISGNELKVSCLMPHVILGIVTLGIAVLNGLRLSSSGVSDC